MIDCSELLSEYGQAYGYNPAIPERHKPFGDRVLSLKCVDCSAGEKGSQGFPAIKNWDTLNKEKDHMGANVEHGNVDQPGIY